MRGWLLAPMLVGVLGPVAAGAQVYHWVDEGGTVHYSTGIESVPERFRLDARPLPASPGASPALEPDVTPPPAGTTAIPFTPGAPIRVSVRLNGAGPVTLIIDTGADRTMVSPAALWRLGIATPNTFTAEVRGVTGATRADVVWVSALEVGDAVVGPMPIIAHDAGLAQADGLLGRDFLSAFVVTIDAKASVVTLTQKGYP